MPRINRICAYTGLIIVAIMSVSLLTSRAFYSTGKAALKSNLFNENYSTYNKILKTRNDIEKAFNETSLKMPFIEINGAISLAFNKKTHNSVIRLSDGTLTIAAMNNNPNVALNNADAIIKLRDYLDVLNIPLLYVHAPQKNVYGLLPAGTTDYRDVCADLFIEKLNNNGINKIVLRNKIGESNSDTFFNTDHHWLPEAAFRSFGIVGEELIKNYGFNIDKEFFNINNYNSKIYKNWFLGSAGKRVGRIYATQTDDISILTPKFDTSFEVSTYHGNSNIDLLNGNFEQTMIVKENIENKDYYNLNPYAAYSGGDFPLQTVTNNLQTNGKKILLVRDSFACAFSPFLALTCSELYITDRRWNTLNTLYELIETYEPDIVIFLYSANTAEASASVKAFIFE